MAIALNQFITGTASNVSSANVLFSSAVSSGNSVIILHAYTKNAGAFSTCLDPVNAAGYTQRAFSTMSNAADTNAHALIHDKLNISSGRGASTYRVSFNYTAACSPGICAMEWSGGPLVFGSTVSANGTSTGPQAGALTASSTPLLHLSVGIHNSAGSLFNSTVGAGGPHVYLTTVDPSNANQVCNVIYSLDSSLTQNLMHSMNTSTRWLSAAVVYTGLGSGGGAAVINPWQMGLMGMTDKVY